MTVLKIKPTKAATELNIQESAISNSISKQLSILVLIISASTVGLVYAREISLALEFILFSFSIAILYLSNNIHKYIISMRPVTKQRISAKVYQFKARVSV
jgi:hypothetical protein